MKVYSMSALDTLPVPAVHPQRKRFTREEAHRMAELGLVSGRYELVDGDLIDKMGQNPPHAYTFTRLQSWLLTFLEANQLRLQLPIEVAPQDQRRSEPEPDIAIVAEDRPQYQSRHPRGDELLIVIEIADTSAAFDLSVKAGLYARAGVREYWVLDLNRRALFRHRQIEQSTYREVQALSDKECASLACRPEQEILVAKLLPNC
jgi:Uma2 family endonuclease